MKICKNCKKLVPQKLNRCPFCNSKDFDRKQIKEFFKLYHIIYNFKEIGKYIHIYGIPILILLLLIGFTIVLFSYYPNVWTPESTTIFVAIVGVIGTMVGGIIKHIFGTIEGENEHRRRVKEKMFEKIHEYIKDHYCQLSWHALALSINIEIAKKSLKDIDIKLAFFFLTRFYSILRRLQEKIGKVVLDSPLGETEIEYILTLIGIKLGEIGISFEDLNMLREAVDPPLENKTWLYFDKFLELLNEDKNIYNIYKKFKMAVEKNIDPLEHLIDLLKVLAVEIENRIYKIYRTWYGESPSFQAQLKFINLIIENWLGTAK